MQTDPVEEGRRLAEHYRGMYDGELLELAEGFGDLTEQAQRALSDEMRGRGLGDPRAPRAAGTKDGGAAAQRWGIGGGPADEGEPEIEYTWKVALCECDGEEQAVQVREALRGAGIESWIEAPRFSIGLSYPRVLVAADQLEEARAVAGRPIPEEMAEKEEMEAGEFDVPACPKCGAEDPLLVSVDPVNSWECESCGKQWADGGEGER